MVYKKVVIYTDGACSGNPGYGGWAAILKYEDIEKEISGYEENTTNNRMEMTAVIEGLSALKQKCDVTVITDSKYIVDSIEKGWVYNWKKRNWRKSNNEAALNVDLWEKILDLLEKHNVIFRWVKGHSGDPTNERCDFLAVMMSKDMSKDMSKSKK